MPRGPLSDAVSSERRRCHDVTSARRLHCAGADAARSQGEDASARARQKISVWTERESVLATLRTSKRTPFPWHPMANHVTPFDVDVGADIFKT